MNLLFIYTLFDVVQKRLFYSFYHFLCSSCHLISEDNPDFVKFLPMLINVQETAYLKISGCNIHLF